jgi:hypothetical protein
VLTTFVLRYPHFVAGKSSKEKLKEIRAWIRLQPTASKDKDPKDAPVATLLTSLANIGLHMFFLFTLESN